jgi:hypothetical protein
LAEAEERRRRNVAQGGGLVAGRPLDETERDGLWAVTGMEVYQVLVERGGWSPDRYERWLADTMVRLLRPRAKERS